TTEVVSPSAIRRLMRLVAEAPDTMVVVDNAENVDALARAAVEDRVTLNVMIDVDVGNRRTGVQPGETALALGRLVVHRGALRLRGLQGYAGHCAHVMGWAQRREASRAAMAPLMDTRARFEADGLPVEIVAGGSTGTHDIDVELGGLTELQSGSYCVLDLDYRRIGGRAGRAMVDDGLKAFSTDKPFPPEAVERPGVEYGFAGDEHGRLTITDPSRAPRLGERIEFFPPHCDPTINLYDRVWCVRGLRVEAVW